MLYLSIYYYKREFLLSWARHVRFHIDKSFFLALTRVLYGLNSAFHLSVNRNGLFRDLHIGL